MQNTTKRITEGAMMCALFGVLLFLNRQFAGMIEYLMYWIFTFPILIYTAKYGWKASLATGMSMFFLSMMLGTISTMFYAGSCIVIGAVYGGGVRKEWSNGKLLLSSFVLTFLSYIVTMVLFAAIFGYSIEEDIEFITMLLSMLHIQSGIRMDYMLIIFTAVTVILTSVLQTFCIHLLSQILLERLHIAHRKMNSILDISLPKWVGWISIMIWVLFYAQNMIKLNEESTAIICFLYIMMQVLCFGYGCLTYMSLILLARKRFYLFLLVIAGCIPVTRTIVIVTGILDLLREIRKSIKESAIHEQVG